MDWLAENAQNGYFLLGFVAFMLAGVWWIQRQIIYLAGAGLTLVLLLVFWLVIRNVPTTAMKIEADLNALAQAILSTDQEKAFRHVDPDFKYKAKDREKWYKSLAEMIAEDQVDAIEVKDFRLKSHSGADKETSVDFHLIARSKGKTIYSADCPWKVTFADGVWQIHKVQLRKAE